MKRIAALAVIGFLIAMTLPKDAFKGAPPKQLIAPMAYYVVIDPVDWAIGYLAGRAANWMIQNWNNGQVWGNACSTNSCPQGPTGGGGGGGFPGGATGYGGGTECPSGSCGN
jgi:hypothetical protein